MQFALKLGIVQFTSDLVLYVLCEVYITAFSYISLRFHPSVIFDKEDFCPDVQIRRAVIIYAQSTYHVEKSSPFHVWFPLGMV